MLYDSRLLLFSYLRINKIMDRHSFQLTTRPPTQIHRINRPRIARPNFIRHHSQL
jgi:hypothetical protein